MIYVVNYADGAPYEHFRKICTKSAYKYGKADKVIEYSKADIEESYLLSHKEIFSYERGGGLWLWKPYLVNKALDSLEENDWLFYTDSGSIFLRSIQLIINCAQDKKTDIVLFEQPLLHQQFTKHESMVKMDIADRGGNQTLGIFLVKKTKRTVALMKEWLNYCECEDIISPKRFYPEILQYDNFVAHREDQSVLSALRIKYNIEPFRDPSDYGEMPFQYATCKDFIYNPVIYTNSKYPTILLCSRRVHPYKYFILYIIRKALNKVNIKWTEKQFLNRFGCKKK